MPHEGQYVLERVAKENTDLMGEVMPLNPLAELPQNLLRLSGVVVSLLAQDDSDTLFCQKSGKKIFPVKVEQQRIAPIDHSNSMQAAAVKEGSSMFLPESVWIQAAGTGPVDQIYKIARFFTLHHLGPFQCQVGGKALPCAGEMSGKVMPMLIRFGGRPS